MLLGASEIGRASKACNQLLVVGQATGFTSLHCHVVLISQMHNTVEANIFLCDVYSKNDLSSSTAKASQETCTVCIC